MFDFITEKGGVQNKSVCKSVCKTVFLFLQGYGLMFILRL